MEIIELRKVSVLLANKTMFDNLVPAADVLNFAKAMVKLHTEGNPHNDIKPEPSARIVEIVAWGPPDIKKYWWSAPSLQNEEDPETARVIFFNLPQTVWTEKEGYVELS